MHIIQSIVKNIKAPITHMIIK